MARRPFFSGNYGSALGSTANAANIIARAGEQQGQRLANMGAQIGGMIQQYGLNKEKQKENKATIKSSIGILQRMSKIDEANAPQYMAQIQQLENEDVPLSQRGMLADKTLQGLSITNQLQGQMLNNQGREQALGLARKLEASTIKNAELTNKQKELSNLLDQISFDEANAIKDEKTKVALLSLIEKNKDLGLGDLRRDVERGRLESEQNLQGYEDASKISGALLERARNMRDIGLIPKRTAAIESSLDTSIVKDQATQQILPGQTSLTSKQQEVQSKQLDVENQLMDIVGIKGLAQMKADDLKTLSETNKAKLEHTKAYANYIRNKGMADLITAVNKSSPTFKDRFKPLAEMQGSLLSQNVQVPGENKRVKFSEYLELHNKDSDKYPLTGLARDLDAQLKTLELSTQNLLREQQVQVNVPDEPQASNPTLTPTNTTGLDYNYSNLDPSAAELMAGPGALTRQQITDPAIISMLRQGGTFRGKNLEQLIAEGAIIGQ